MGLQVLNRLMEPMELSASQLADYKSPPFCDLSGEYPFPEDLLPKHSKAESNVPYMTLVSCFCELPVSVLGASPSLIRVLDTNRTDDRRFLSWQLFGEEVFLQCFRQSHQDIFGMVEVTTALEYVIHRLKGALYEDWTEDKPLLRACIREGSVAFCYLREILGDLIELWPSIRPYIRYTGHPHFKSTVDRVSTVILLVYFNPVSFLCSLLCFPVLYMILDLWYNLSILAARHRLRLNFR